MTTAALEDFAPATDVASRAYAVHYRVTGKTCSLLMLDTEADYARFDIKDEDETARVQQTLSSDVLTDAVRQNRERRSEIRKSDSCVGWTRSRRVPAST